MSFLSFINRSKSKHGRVIDVRKPKSFVKGGFNPEHETAIIIHGFNGTQTSQHIMFLKDGKFVELCMRKNYVILICCTSSSFVLILL